MNWIWHRVIQYHTWKTDTRLLRYINLFHVRMCLFVVVSKSHEHWTSEWVWESNSYQKEIFPFQFLMHKNFYRMCSIHGNDVSFLFSLVRMEYMGDGHTAMCTENNHTLGSEEAEAGKNNKKETKTKAKAKANVWFEEYAHSDLIDCTVNVLCGPFVWINSKYWAILFVYILILGIKFDFICSVYASLRSFFPSL